MMMMHKAVKVLPSGLWARVEGVVGRSVGEQGLWQKPAMAMSTKLDGSTKSGIDEGSPGNNPAEREAFKSDMDSSYGDAYSTRSSDEGFGERYGEAVKVVLEEKDTRELQRGETAERDQSKESVKQVQYDTSQGEHVREKEVARHSEKGTAFKSDLAAHKRQEENHKSEGGRGGAAT